MAIVVQLGADEFGCPVSSHNSKSLRIKDSRCRPPFRLDKSRGQIGSAVCYDGFHAAQRQATLSYQILQALAGQVDRADLAFVQLAG